MIVRIMTDNQYRLGDEHLAEIERLDDQLIGAMDGGDGAAFTAALDGLVTLVRERGTVVPMEEVVPSDILVPAPDMSLDEAHALLQGVEARQPASGEQRHS